MTEPHVFPARTCPACGCSLRNWPPLSNKWECLICDVEVYHEGEEAPAETEFTLSGITTEQAITGLRLLSTLGPYGSARDLVGYSVAGAERPTVWVELEVEQAQLLEHQNPPPPLKRTEVGLSTFKRWCAWLIVMAVAFLAAFYAVTLMQAARL